MSLTKPTRAPTTAPIPATSATGEAAKDAAASSAAAPVTESPINASPSLSYKARVTATLADWRERWPVVFTTAMPLALGIVRPIREQTGLNRKDLGTALRHWTTTTPYLQAVVRGDVRRNLDGSEAGVPDEAAREYARNLLRERSKRNKARSAERAREKEGASG